MLRVALREVRAHGVRFALSVLAVVLGVAFVAGTFSLREMLSQTFESIVASSVQGEVYVRGSQETGEDGGGFGGGSRNPVAIGIAEELDDVAGVAVALPDVQGPLVLVGADGTAVINGQAPSFGIGLDPDDPSVRVVDGRTPRGDEEIAVESAALAASGLAVGDRTSIVLDDVRDVTVVGEVAYDTQTVGATLVFLSPELARATFAPDDVVASIAVYAEPGSDVDTLRGDVEAALTATNDIEVVSGDQLREEASEAVNEIIGFIGTFLLVFAAIALFVGAFIIGNTFAMSVRQRQREYAMLRAIGASPGQVFGVVMTQAAAVGIIGSALGFAAGTGLVHGIRAVLARMGMTLGTPPAADPVTLAWCLGAGTLVSVVAAAVPARRAALTAPVEAMRDDVAVTDRSLRGRAVVGLVLLLLGVGAVLWAVRLAPDESSDAEIWLGAGAAGVLLGTLAIAPVVARSVLRVLALPFLPLRPLGRLARGNVTRNPRRTATTAGALMIGMALVAACTVLASSATASTTAIVDGETRADLIVQSATNAVPAAALTAVREVDGVARIDALRTARVEVTGPGVEADATTVTALPPQAIGTSLQIRGLEGDPGALAPGSALIGNAAATENDWQVGTELTLEGDAGRVEVEVVAVTDSQLLSTDVVVADADLDDVVPAEAAQTVIALVQADPGVDVVDLQADTAAVLAPFVTVAVLTPDELTDLLAEQVEQALVVIYALLGLSVVIAVLGIVNTLALSVIERTREIGLVRAVGLGRLQLSTTIVIESVLTAVFGTVLGLLVGVGLAAALQSVFAADGLTVLDVPFSQLGAILALSVVVGVVAALWPAVRASRLPVLQAIAQE